MSVSIEDILKLPSMYNAKVVAGRGGINRIISTVSVLETVDPELIDLRVNKSTDIGGSEIVITSFINAINDEELQFQNVRQLAESGEAGLIIYYVGVFLKEISRKIIEYADENDFVIICMPKNQPELRYSDAISDIMGAIIRDRDQNHSLVVSLLDTIARMPEARRTVNTMIRLASERLHSTIILADATGNEKYQAAWPNDYKDFGKLVLKRENPEDDQDVIRSQFLNNAFIQRRNIRVDTEKMELLFITIGHSLDEQLINSATEAVRISMSIWEQQNKDAAISELIKAILDDDPLKMRSLAALFGIDISSINAMWVFRDITATFEQAKALADFVKMYSETSFADIYDHSVILFCSSLESRNDIQAVYEYAAKLFCPDVRSAFFYNLTSTTDVQNVFLLYRQEIDNVKMILPNRPFYTKGDLQFSEECRKIVDEGEENLKKILSILDPLKRLRDADSMIETLTTYLLDADQGIVETSRQLYVHKNTIKYRLNMMSDCMGYRIGEMPATYDLYRAVGVKRLIGA